MLLCLSVGDVVLILRRGENIWRRKEKVMNCSGRSVVDEVRRGLMGCLYVVLDECYDEFIWVWVCIFLRESCRVNK